MELIGLHQGEKGKEWIGDKNNNQVYSLSNWWGREHKEGRLGI